jgi:hypothetical protein
MHLFQQAIIFPIVYRLILESDSKDLALVLAWSPLVHYKLLCPTSTLLQNSCTSSIDLLLEYHLLRKSIPSCNVIRPRPYQLETSSWLHERLRTTSNTSAPSSEASNSFIQLRTNFALLSSTLVSTANLRANSHPFSGLCYIFRSLL